MHDLFDIHTDDVSLTVGLARGKEPASIAGDNPLPGTLRLIKRNPELKWTKIWRADVPSDIAADPEVILGPRLFEQSDYRLFLSTASGKVELKHRDPLLLTGLDSINQGRTVYGYINFGSQIGYSRFTVELNGKAQFDFEVEVFPSKLDYQTDYEMILAEVQQILTGLALEYLRSTYLAGTTRSTHYPSNVEWLTLLQNVITDLEKALQHISRQPIRGLKRENRPVRVERISHIDSSLRSAVRAGKGKGGVVRLGSGLAIRERILESQPQVTLDTAEHRWIKYQLKRIMQRIRELRYQENLRTNTVRREKSILEMEDMEKRILRLSCLEPFQMANGDPLSGFASLQLLGSPGYKEAYKTCQVLSLGLRIEGGPLNLSVKDLSLLYEYWCYLAFLRLLAEETGQAIPVNDIFAIEQRGLQVLLQKGKANQVMFAEGERSLMVDYNPSFHNENMLIPQCPDIVLTLENEKWPRIRLVLDAKYRLDASTGYRSRYRSAGPPQDALNAMHRYRDAILEYDAYNPQQLNKTVIQAAALFPYNNTSDDFKNSKLWQSLERIGIGALPFLPENKEYVRAWLQEVLARGGFSVARRTIPHSILKQAEKWRLAASEAVLVGVLNGKNPEQHLNWINEQKVYYMPLLKTQLRQYEVKWLAIYSPLALRTPGAVTHIAEVKKTEIMARKYIKTPWPARREPDELQLVYHLNETQVLKEAILNKGQRFSRPRWTSRLAMERARVLEELFLETEPEWRLYEDLQVMGLEFKLEPGQVTVNDPDNPRGRIWFVSDSWRIRYGGASGFILRSFSGSEHYFLEYNDLLQLLGKK